MLFIFYGQDNENKLSWNIHREKGCTLKRLHRLSAYTTENIKPI